MTLVQRRLGIGQQPSHAWQDPLVTECDSNSVCFFTNCRIAALQQRFVGWNPGCRLRDIDPSFEGQPDFIKHQCLLSGIGRTGKPIDRRGNRLIRRSRSTDDEASNLFQLGIPGQRHCLGRIGHYQRFNSIPQHQWQVVIHCIFAVCQQIGSQFPALIQRQALQSRCQVETNNSGWITLSHVDQLRHDGLADLLVFEFKLNPPASQVRVAGFQNFHGSLVVNLAQRMQCPESSQFSSDIV